MYFLENAGKILEFFVVNKIAKNLQEFLVKFGTIM